jgi:hypothetical protein
MMQKQTGAVAPSSSPSVFRATTASSDCKDGGEYQIYAPTAQLFAERLRCDKPTILATLALALALALQ